MKVKNYIPLLFFAFILNALPGQVNSPNLKCLFVQANGDVTLTWVIPADPNNQFIAYHIFTNTSLGGGFSPITSINNYNSVSYTHTGAGANTQPIYYYIITEYNNSGSTFSVPLDTFSTIYLTVTNPGSPYGTLNYNAIHNPLPSTNSGLYNIYKDYPAPNTLMVTQTGLSYADTEYVCNRTINYYVLNHDNTGCVSRSNINGGLFKDNIIPSTPVVDSVSVNPATNQANIGWNVSSDGDVTAYVIYQYISGFWVPIDTVFGHNSSFYTNPNSAAGTKSEMYCMAAMDSCGNLSPLGNNQNTIFAKAAVDKCMRTVTLTWNNYVNWPTGVTGFSIFASYNGGPFNAIGSVGPNTFSFVHTGIINGNWCYIIRAYNSMGMTSSSQKLCVAASVAVMPAFTYVTTASVINTAQIQVKTYVDLAASVQSYRLERSDAATGPYALVTTLPYSGNAVIAFTDNTASPSKKSYYYHVISTDSCGHDAQTSAYSRTIYLQAVANANRTNTITWSHYEGWLMGVGSYDIYRSIDGGPFQAVGSVNYPATTYTDDVDPYFNSNGKFTYYVEAREAAVNMYNFQESSRSNPGDCYQNSRFFVPNAFAPSGVNQVFLPVGSYYDKTEYSLMIFDRWGEKIFETTNATLGWNGTYNGNKCYQGVYVYYIRYKTSVGEMIEQKGTVTLLGK